MDRTLKHLIITRALDVFTTLIQVSYEAESNPVMRVLLHKPLLYITYQVCMTLAIIGLYNKHRLVKQATKIFVYLSYLTIISNFIVFIYVH